MQLPSNVQHKNQGDVNRNRGEVSTFGVPVMFDQRLWNVESTTSGGGYYYFVCGNSVFMSVHHTGPFSYIGEKGSEVVLRHEAHGGIRF